MAKNNTTLSAAFSATEEVPTLASGTGVSDGRYVVFPGGEVAQIVKGTTAGTTTPRLKRGLQGTAPDAYVAGAAVTIQDASDMVATTPQQVITYPQVLTTCFDTYVAAGAISFGAARWTIAQVLGTSTIAMTVASPTIDQKGIFLTSITSAKSASTLQINDGTAGIGNAGSGYDILTLQNGGLLGQTFVASNGFWCLLSSPVSGTLTAISMGVA